VICFFPEIKFHIYILQFTYFYLLALKMSYICTLNKNDILHLITIINNNGKNKIHNPFLRSPFYFKASLEDEVGEGDIKEKLNRSITFHMFKYIISFQIVQKQMVNEKIKRSSKQLPE